jgi:hypothetical protein
MMINTAVGDDQVMAAIVETMRRLDEENAHLNTPGLRGVL